jgi:hypothetical protein
MAYDNVLKKYIHEDKLNLLPQIFKEKEVVKAIKNERRAMRFGFE